MVLRLALTVALAATVLAGPQAAASEAKPVRAAYGSVVIGKSVQGRPIGAWHLGETKKPKVVLIAGMHGNEPAPTAILRMLRDGKSVHGIDLWVVPAYNPDGLAHRSRRNAHGVDLNRNYPYHWAPLTGSYYSGPKPASEPETRAMMRFLALRGPREKLNTILQPIISCCRQGWASRPSTPSGHSIGVPIDHARTGRGKCLHHGLRAIL